MLQPYVKSTQLFACPSNTGNTGTTTPKNLATSAGGVLRSYVCNGTDGTAPSETNNIGGTAPMRNDGMSESLAALGSSAQIILVTESDPGWDFPELDFGHAVGGTSDHAFKGHLNTVNFLFADGHVKTMKPAATGTPVNMWSIEDDGAGPASLTDRLNAWQVKVNTG